jgi:predicted translin family RNA/ssDNA-binding protein
LLLQVPSQLPVLFPYLVQEQLNAAVPQAEERAVQLQQRVARVCRDAAAAQANMAAVQDIRRELAELTMRLQRLHSSIAELNELAAEQECQQPQQQGLQEAAQRGSREQVVQQPREEQLREGQHEHQGPDPPPGT